MRLVDSMVLLVAVDMLLLAGFFGLVMIAIRRFRADKEQNDAVLAPVEAAAEQAEDTV